MLSGELSAERVKYIVIDILLLPSRIYYYYLSILCVIFGVMDNSEMVIVLL